MSDYMFSATVSLPDGRSIYASVDIPEGHPAVHWRNFAEYSEIAQIAVVHALRNVQRGDISRQRDENEAEAAF